MYEYQRKLLKELSVVEEPTIYGAPSSYALIPDFTEFVAKLMEVNPTLVASPYRSATVNTKESKILEEFDVYFDVDVSRFHVYTEPNFLDTGLDEYNKILEKHDEVYLSVPELGTYYLLALGLISLDDVYGLFLGSQDTGLPFDLYLTKKKGVLERAFMKGFEIPFIYEQTVYCLFKQMEDEDYIDFLRQATASAQVLHHHIYNYMPYYKFQHYSFSRKVVTPRFQEKLISLTRSIDLFDFTCSGLTPAYAHLLFGVYYSEDKELREEAYKALQMALKVGKTLGGLG